MNNFAYLHDTAVGTEKTIKKVEQFLKETHVHHVHCLFTPEAQYLQKTSFYDKSKTSTRIVPIRECRIFVGVDKKTDETLNAQLESLATEIRELESAKNSAVANEQKALTDFEKVKAQKKELEVLKRRHNDLKQKIDELTVTILELQQEEDLDQQEHDLRQKIRRVNEDRVKLTDLLVENWVSHAKYSIEDGKFPLLLQRIFAELREIEEMERRFMGEKRELEGAFKNLEERLTISKSELKRLKTDADKRKNAFKEKYHVSDEDLKKIFDKLPDDLEILNAQIAESMAAADSIYNDPISSMNTKRD